MFRPLPVKRHRVSNPTFPPRYPEDGLQLHNFTPASILHIAGYVALCKLFLGCEAHFELWRKLFYLVPRNHEGSIFEVGGAKIWRIAETGYLSGTPKKASEE